MKKDRILEIIIYLVNHDNVPARERLWMALLLRFGRPGKGNRAGEL